MTMRVGLVLGAGGVVGASWLIGALEALQSETGWDPACAEYLIGTSAGSVVGSLCAGGVSPEMMGAYVAGRALDEFAEAEVAADELASGVGEGEAERSSASEYRLARALPPLGPGSWRMAFSTLLHARQHAPPTMLSAWLPRGVISADPIKRLVERFVAGDWPEHPNFWAVACDYRTGRRVPFGREGSPRARVADAVAASCAIPGFYHPVTIDGRRYIDGGVCSLSNLDLLCGRELDLAICLNPTSSLATVSSRRPTERFASAMRASSGRRLGHEARKLHEEGTEVLLLQPSAEDLAVMGANLMARGRRVQVIEAAMLNTAQQLRRMRKSGQALPSSGAPRRRAARAPAAGANRAA